MKSRRKMQQRQLVRETIDQMQSRFAPKVVDINHCIELLVQREFLERIEGEDDVFGYLA